MSVSSSIVATHLLPSLLQPFLASSVRENQSALQEELRAGGALLTPIPFNRLEALGGGHPFFEVLGGLREHRLFSSDQPAVWRVDFRSYDGDSKHREICSHWANLTVKGYYPESFRRLRGEEDKGIGLLEDPLLAVASALSVRHSPFRLVPVSKMPSLSGLADFLDSESWPLYAGRERVRIHGYWASAYGAGVHDLLHYVAWKRRTAEDRKDSILLYRALRSVLVTTLPSLGSLAGRLGARLFYGDGFFYQEMTALDECLSGPPGLRGGVFAQETLENLETCLRGDPSRFYAAVEKAFSRHPREGQWRQAIDAVRAGRGAA